MGLRPTPSPSREREGSEPCRAGGEVRRSGVGVALILLASACAPARIAEAPPAPVAAPPPAAPVDFLLVDKSDRTLVLYANGQPVRRYTGLQFGDAPLGHKRFEGDERTPEGDYVIDTRNPNSAYHLSLRVSYPNARDRAFAESQGRSPGGDIFLHGQPNGFAGRVAGDWTDGCIAFSNAEIEELWRLVADGTRIRIRP